MGGGYRAKRVAPLLAVIAAAAALSVWLPHLRARGPWVAASPAPLPESVAWQWTEWVIADSGMTAVAQIPAGALRSSDWRILAEARWKHRRAHVRLWAFPVQLTGGLPSRPYRQPPTSAGVWVVGVEGYCNEIAPSRLGPVGPTALCWEDTVYMGDTGQPWFAVTRGRGPGNPTWLPPPT